VAAALDRAAINDDLLFDKDLAPVALELHVLKMVPDGDRDLSGDLYARILHESCNYIIEIRTTLPGFGLRAIQESLQREGEIIALVKQVLEAMPRSRGAGAGDESDEAFESQYRQNVARELDQLRLFGITTERVSPRYGLSVAYITLSAARTHADDEAASDDDEGDAGMGSMPVDEALAGSERVLIRGEAGSGKTTLLQWLAVQSARDAFAGPLKAWNGLVPFFIQLRRWVGKDLPQPEQWLTDVARPIAGAMPPGWVHRRLDGGALVLIDGLDELPDAERERVREWLQGLIANAKAARFIVTSRPAAAEEGWLREEGFDDSQLQAMEREQIDALIDQWHAAARKQITDDEILANLDQYQESLKQVVHTDRSIRNLATTPLLCAMLCLLNVDRRTRIPTDRMALYRIALETLARREAERDTDAAGTLELTERQRELALEELAYWLIRNDRSDAARADAEGVIADTLPQFADQKEYVVQYLLERSGLLREPVVDRIDFIHRTFQEYLAAKRIIAAHDVGVLLWHAHEPTWREVVILATGHASDGGGVILKGLLDRADKEPGNCHYLSLLAVSCLETATAFSPEVRRTVENRLSELVPPRNMTEAKALASAGEIAVPHLGGHSQAKAARVAACVRTLAMIGSEAALGIISQYISDGRTSVTDELLRARESFDYPEYDRRVLSRIESIVVGTKVRNISSLSGLTSVQFVNLAYLEIVTDLSPLASLTALRQLDLSGCKGVTDLTPLAGLTGLQSLDLSRCTGVSDLNALAGLRGLQSLNLQACTGVSDLSPLAGLTELHALDLRGCRGVSDLSALAGLAGLESLNLQGCRGVSDLSPLAGLTGLHSLDLRGCTGITDLSPLASLTGLQSLDPRGCTGITDLSPLASLTELHRLDLERCAGVTDLSPLASLTGLDRLDLEGCTGITDLSPLASLTGLHRLDMELCTGVTDLGPLASLTRLLSLHLRGCTSVTDLSPLAGLARLLSLDLQGCTGVTDLAPLSGLTSLHFVWISDPKLLETAAPRLRSRIRVRPMKTE
jgi:Leucine-rich repeat (LRR) protein